MPEMVKIRFLACHPSQHRDTGTKIQNYLQLHPIMLGPTH